MKKIMLIALTVLTLVMTMSCSGPKMRKSQSVMDSPEMHISRGMKYFDNGEYEDAKKEFKDAINIKWDKEAEKAVAYGGLGMYYAVKGNEEKAMDNVEKAEDLNDKDPMVFVAYGRTLYLLNKGKDSDNWFSDADEKFEDAISLADEKRDTKALASAWYFRGMSAKMAYKFSASKKAFGKVVELKSLYAEEANKQWEIVQMIERAKPGTRVGSKVALMDKVGRAEIAVLFVEELKINDILKKKEKKTYDNSFKAPEDPMKLAADRIAKLADATDIDKHWAKSWINDVIGTGVMEAGPNHKFDPDAKISRAEYALMLLRVLVLVTGDEALYTKYFGEENSSFNDMRTSHPAYNAAKVCVTRGIMKANMAGEFRKDKTISGAEALLIIRDFQNALTIAF